MLWTSVLFQSPKQGDKVIKVLMLFWMGFHIFMLLTFGSTAESHKFYGVIIFNLIVWISAVFTAEIWTILFWVINQQKDISCLTIVLNTIESVQHLKQNICTWFFSNLFFSNKCESRDYNEKFHLWVQTQELRFATLNW